MAEQNQIPDELSFEEAHPSNPQQDIPDELSYEQAHPATYASELEKKNPYAAGAVAALSGAAHAVPFAEDIAAGANTLRSYLGGRPAGVPTEGTFGERFDAAKRAQMAVQDALREQYPVQSIGGELLGYAGSAATAPMKALAAGETALASRLAPKIGETAAKATASAATGAGLSAAYGAGEGVDDRLSGAINGVIGGGLAGGAMPLAGKLATKAWEKTAPLIPYGGFAERIGARHGDEAVDDALRLAGRRSSSPLTKQDLEDAGKYGLDILPIDVAGKAGSRLAKEAINLSPDAEKKIRDVLTERNAGQQGRLHNFVAEHIYGSPGKDLFSNEARDKIRTKAQSFVNDDYKHAYELNPSVNSSDLTEAVNYSLVQKAIPKAVERMNDALIMEGKAPIPNPFVKAKDGRWMLKRDYEGDPIGAPLQVWDYVKRELSSKADRFKPTAFQAGDREKHMQHSLVAKQISDALRHVSPEYRSAASGAGKYLGEESAWAMGPKILSTTKATDLNAAEKAIAGMSAAERGHLRDSYMQERLAAYDKLRANQNIGSHGLSDFAKRKDRMVLGDEAANKLHTYLMLEDMANQSLSNLGGSDTAMNLMGAAKKFLMGHGRGVGYTVGAEQALGELYDQMTSEKGEVDPMKLFRAFAGPALAGHFVTAHGKASAAMAQQIADRLISKDPQQVQQAIQTLSTNPGAIKAISSAYAATQALVSNLAQRATRASGGRIGDPAKAASRLDKAVARAMKSLSDDSRPLMGIPDETIAQALQIAKKR